jgi:hypothetical protein
MRLVNALLSAGVYVVCLGNIPSVSAQFSSWPCPEGYVWNGTTCVRGRIAPPPPPPPCPAGTVWNGTTCVPGRIVPP